ncbi:uncharacterized protein LOC129591013 [Paramacrobiotus metropolitanus]|uniref:uncharacterized protein LOC129591013 n=1 Tax=Paramacrobiotus metropolitanus TaxID=2943436 RepID=UPI0024457252|nr:uncharacterized protein LOC129591013 [Paramacrobiotus metropolitanus]
MLGSLACLMVLVGVSAEIGVIGFNPGRVSQTFLPGDAGIDIDSNTDVADRPRILIVTQNDESVSGDGNQADENSMVDDIGTIGINNGLIKEYNYKQKYRSAGYPGIYGPRPYYDADDVAASSDDQPAQQNDIGEIGINNGQITEYNFKQRYGHRRHRYPIW